MRKVKKLLGLLLAAVMVLAMGVPTFAADEFTITAPDNDHTYEIYQVFTGDYSEGVLSNVKWGQNGIGTVGEPVDKDILDALADVNSASDTGKLEVIEQYVTLQSDNAFGTVSSGSSLTVPGGYYLIKDKDGSQEGENDSYTLYIVEVADNVTITPKADVPTFEKKVKDVDDSSGTTTGWQDSADYDIGDKVDFRLIGTVSTRYDDYETYQFIFHDRESTGLTFDASSVKVYVDDSLIESGYQTVTEGLEDGCTFEIRFDNLKNIDSVHAGSVITVEYQSKLNENAVIGSEGNPNTANLEFSNNPNGDGMGETPDDTVIVFTYKTVINKVDEAGDPLDGAAFRLEKFVANEDGSETQDNIRGNWETVEEIAAAENKTSFEFSGLDDGIYRLTETTTPPGYNTMDPIIFEITAEHEVLVLAGDIPELTDLNGNKVSGEITLTPNLKDGSLTSNVVNHQGSTLPETGGMGTTIFYVLGAILVLGAGVLLIARRRTDSEK